MNQGNILFEAEFRDLELKGGGNEARSSELVKQLKDIISHNISRLEQYG